jgi:putative FmdB family regulatory protein
VPLYEYQCLPERHSFEVRHGMNEEPVSTCSICGGPVRRVIQPVGIVFKGSGFYVNDSRKSSSTAQTASGAKTTEGASDSSKDSKDSASGDKGDTKESKPAPSAETPSKPAAAS